MSSVCFYFQVHQPLRLRQNYSFFDIGTNHYYEDDSKNCEILRKVANKCYLPTNKLMLDLIKKHGPKFRISYSISGIALEQFERYCPEVIDSFKQLINTGNVELLSETYYHSLASVFSPNEFIYQIKLHQQKIKDYFNSTPTVFRNTELIYNNDIAKIVESLGFKGMMTEGTDKSLIWRSPNFVYTPKNTQNLKLLLKNYRLSDDIAFRFSNSSWESYPLTSEKYATWLKNASTNGDTINLFMDYETFGEHQWEHTGIFNFLSELPQKVFENGMGFHTPSDIIDLYQPKGELDIPQYISWADSERDLSAWLGNNMQNSSANLVYALEEMVQKTQDDDLASVWRKLQASDHLYYMSTKKSADGAVHNYFTPYNSPYDAYVIFSNVLADLKLTLEERLKTKLNALLENTHPEPSSQSKSSSRAKSSNKKNSSHQAVL